MSKGKKSYGKGSKSRDSRDNKNVRRNPVQDEYSSGPDKGKRKGDNDLSWHNGYPQLTQAVASIPFNVFPGVPRTLSYGQTNAEALGEANYFTGKYATPGIVILEYMPTIGISDSATSAVNMAARALYTFIRGMNSGKTNYEGTDSFLYCLAAAEAYAFYTSMCRAYGSIKYWDAQNRYAGKYIVEALGYDYEDLVTNLANFRAYINYFAIQINKLAVPTAIPLFARRIWCEAGIYRDDNLAKAQFYAMRRAGWLVYQEMEGEQTYGTLNLEKDSSLKNLTALKTLGNAIIEPLLKSEDINIISGDILKAFGNSGLATAGQISDDLTVIPEFNPNVLMQFRNCKFNHSMLSSKEDWITQDPERGIIRTNYFVGTPLIKRTLSKQCMIDIAADNIDAGMVMEATRLTTNWTQTGPVFKIQAVGTELPVRISMHAILTDTDEPYFGTRALLTSYSNMDDADAESASFLAHYTQYNFAPMLETYFYHEYEDSDPVFEITGPIGNVSNLTYATWEQIAAIHDVDCVSLFRVPGMGEFANGR